METAIPVSHTGAFFGEVENIPVKIKTVTLITVPCGWTDLTWIFKEGSKYTSLLALSLTRNIRGDVIKVATNSITVVNILGEFL